MNYAAAFKDAVARIARKEIRSSNAVLKRVTAQHRRDIAKLKREIAALKKQKSVPTGIIKEASAKDIEGARFSARSVRSQRKRLGLSAAAFGQLVGASALTVYHWEAARPNRDNQKWRASLLFVESDGGKQKRSWKR